MFCYVTISHLYIDDIQYFFCPVYPIERVQGNYSLYSLYQT